MTEINHIDKLPIEVLEHIMNFLDQRTRKIARQVSRNWYKACRGFQKIVVSEMYANWVDRILEILTQSDTNFEEIEFHCVNLVDYQCSKFWKRWGYRIKSLQFYDTRISREIFLNILMKSPRLTHIGMHWSLQKKHLSCFNETTCLLDNFIRRELKNNNVISLDISIPRSNSAQFLEKMFTIFPNIKTLKIYNWDHMTRTDESFIIRQTSKWREQLEVLSLRSFADPGFGWKTILLRADLLRLKDIHLNVTADTRVAHITQFIGKLSNLKNLSLEFCGYRIIDESKDLQDFVFTHNSCRNLQVFRLIGPTRLTWSSEFFDLLSTSTLHTLVLDCKKITYIGSENFLINKTLKVLHLTESSPISRQEYNSHMIHFIRTFIGLENIVLAGVTAEIMDAVNQYQTGLRVFRTMHEWFGGSYYNKIEYHVSNLPNLVDVQELSICTNDNDFPCRFLECLRPHLRYLYVEQCMDFELVVKLLPNAPFLDTLIIEVDDDSFLRVQDLFTNVLQTLKNLEYLRISMPNVRKHHFSHSMFFIGNQSYTPKPAPHQPCNNYAKQIFKQCPSLGIFIFMTHLYYYNIIDKRVHLQRDSFINGAHLINNFPNFKNIFLGNRILYVC